MFFKNSWGRRMRDFPVNGVAPHRAAATLETGSDCPVGDGARPCA